MQVEAEEEISETVSGQRVHLSTIVNKKEKIIRKEKGTNQVDMDICKGLFGNVNVLQGGMVVSCDFVHLAL